MIILTALLLTIIPTLLFYILLPKLGIKIRSIYLKTAFAWFTGLYAISFLTFLLCLLLVPFTTNILTKAIGISIIITGFISLFYLNDILELIEKINNKLFSSKWHLLKNYLFLFFLFSFSFLFFYPHLATQPANYASVEGGGNAIFRSPIYWDLPWHAEVIHTFVYGDNFPPLNESFGTIPMTYHFFGDFVFSIYTAIGLDVTASITYISILAFFMALVGVVGFTQEFFKSKFIGFIAVLLIFTSSSGHFYYYLQDHSAAGIFPLILNILSSTTHPWTISFIDNNPHAYNGTMFNLFYFLQERHMIFGIIYMLFSLWVIYNRDRFSSKKLLLFGASLGLYFLWHAHITIMVLAALFFTLLLDSKRKQTLILLTAFSLIFSAHLLYFQNIFNSEWFIHNAGSYTKLNFSFAAIEDKDPSKIQPLAMLEYYAFAYGLKIILLPLGLILLLFRNKKLALLLSSIIIPTFILINSIQMGEQNGTGENHKWLVPMNIIVNIAVAYIVYMIFFKIKPAHQHVIARKNDEAIFFKLLKPIRPIIGILCMFFLMFSGIIEHMPFINSKPTHFYAYFPSAFTNAVQANSSPRSVFLSQYQTDIHLAGRKLFMGRSAGPDTSINKPRHQNIVDQVYASPDLKTFCSLTRTFGIDFVELDPSKGTSLIQLQTTTFTAHLDNTLPVTFINTQKTCLNL